MTPSQLLPPVTPNEAVAIADLIFRLTQGRPWSTDLRGRLASSLPALSLERLTPYPQTLIPDTQHNSTYFLVVLSQNADGPSHWLLHVTPASSPTTPHFPNPILLARVRLASERDAIINAIPLDGNLPAIIRILYPTLLARATNLQNLWSIPAATPALTFLKEVPKRGNVLPALRSREPGWQAYLPILLAGSKEGFVNILEHLQSVPTADQAEPYSRFSYVPADPQDARAIADFHRALKATHPRAFDFELDLSGHATVDLETLLDNLKLLGVPLQSIEVHPQLEVPSVAALLQARQIGITLSAAEPDEPFNGLRTHWKLAGWR